MTEEAQKAWRPIFTGRWTEEGEDEIDKLEREQERIRKEPIPDNVIIGEWRKKQEKRIAEIEVKIWELISIENQKRMFPRMGSQKKVSVKQS